MDINQVHSKITLAKFLQLLITLIFREATGQTIEAAEVVDEVPAEYPLAERNYNPRKLLMTINEVKQDVGIREEGLEHRTRGWYVTKDQRSNSTFLDTYYGWNGMGCKLRSVREVVLFILCGRVKNRTVSMAVERPSRPSRKRKASSPAGDGIHQDEVEGSEGGPRESTNEGGADEKEEGLVDEIKVNTSSDNKGEDDAGIAQDPSNEISSPNEEAPCPMTEPPPSPPPPVEAACPHEEPPVEAAPRGPLFDLNGPPPSPLPLLDLNELPPLESDEE